MTETVKDAGPDLAAVRQKQQQTWASGDFAVIASRMALISERLVDHADLHAGWRVLDVATGSGNAAIAAARLGCDVVGIDYVPALLDRARVRAEAEGFTIEFVEGDAESVPFPDDSFDAVTTVLGSMFAPDHERAAAELLRVCRPGGVIANVSWTPAGYLGEMFRTMGAHVPPPAGVQSPLLWGTEAHLQELFADRVSSLETTEQTFTWRYESPEAFVDEFRTWYGPTLKAFAALEGDPDASDALERDLVALARRSDRLEDGAVAIPAAYLEAIAVVA
jgi:ubiquinone/menaquinone biosynthesis C-methylase UbiE